MFFSYKTKLPFVTVPLLAWSALLALSFFLSACQERTPDSYTAPTPAPQDATDSTTGADTANIDATHSQAHGHDARPIALPDGRVQIDWSLIDTKVAPVDPKGFDYPFAADSSAVKNYAAAYDITPGQAQHAMVLSMASPEALNKLLDQLTDGRYLGHEMRDGKDMALIIYVSDDVVAEAHTYTFADKFAEGLVLPIELQHKNKP